MFAFSSSSEKELEKHLRKYPEERKKSALLAFLRIAQQQEGYVSPESMEEIARRLDLSPAYVQSVCSFYTMYHTRPVGKYVIMFCINVSCHLLGCDNLLEHTAKKLNINVGDTTADGKITLLREECLAECSRGPMMRINDDYHVNLTPEKIDQILDSL